MIPLFPPPAPPTAQHVTIRGAVVYLVHTDGRDEAVSVGDVADVEQRALEIARRYDVPYQPPLFGGGR